MVNDKKTSKKIAIIIPTLAGGGAERFASNLSLFLIKEWNVLNILYENQIVYPYAGKLIAIDSPPGSHAFDKIYKLVSRILKIRRIKMQEGVTLSISVMESSNVINILSAVKDKTIISTRSYRAADRNTRDFYAIVYKFLMRVLYRRVDMMVAVSSLIAQSMVRDYKVRKDRVKVIYNPVDIESIENLSHESAGEFEGLFNSPVIINVGRLTLAKGQCYLIKTFKMVKDSVPDAKLMIVGEGELQNDLIGLCHALGLKVWTAWTGEKVSSDRDVYFIGFRKNPFVLMARARVFVLPSLWEGFPNVLVEAMACAIPVIASDCRSGPREILAPGTDLMYQTQHQESARYGVLMPVFESDKNKNNAQYTPENKIWAKEIVHSLNDNKFGLRYKELAKTRILDFKKERIAQQWEEAMKTVIENGQIPDDE